MTEPVPIRPTRQPSPYAGLLEGAYRPCTELPEAMRALLETLAIREQIPAEPALAASRR